MSTYIKPGQKSCGLYPDCPEVLNDFLNYSESIKGLSVRTVNAYYIDIRSFLRFLLLRRNLIPSQIPFQEIKIHTVDLPLLSTVSKEDLYEFAYFLTRERNNSATSRARKLSAIKSFFHYLCNKTGKLASNPAQDLEMPKLKKSLPKYLSLHESKELLENIESKFWERDYCILALFLNCGMRLSELVSININDIKNDTLRIVGKGNKERTVYLNAACLQATQNLIDTLNQMTDKRKDKQALFISKTTGKRLSARRVQQLVGRSLSTAGLGGKGYSAHKLRHTAATLMHQYGKVDMLALKEILGHSALNTTQIYTHLESAQLKEASQASPLSLFQAENTEMSPNKHVDNPVEKVEKYGKPK